MPYIRPWSDRRNGQVEWGFPPNKTKVLFFWLAGAWGALASCVLTALSLDTSYKTVPQIGTSTIKRAINIGKDQFFNLSV